MSKNYSNFTLIKQYILTKINVKVEAFYSNKCLIFSLEFPLVHPGQFSHYHLYSIPTFNSTTIIPKNTYLTMSSDFYQYQSIPCQDIDSIYFCEYNYLMDGIRKENCKFSILQFSSTSTNIGEVSCYKTNHRCVLHCRNPKTVKNSN